LPSVSWGLQERGLQRKNQNLARELPSKGRKEREYSIVASGHNVVQHAQGSSGPNPTAAELEFDLDSLSVGNLTNGGLI